MLAVDIIETHKQVWSQFILERVYFPVALSPSLSLWLSVFLSVFLHCAPVVISSGILSYTPVALGQTGVLKVKGGKPSFFLSTQPSLPPLCFSGFPAFCRSCVLSVEVLDPCPACLAPGERGFCVPMPLQAGQTAAVEWSSPHVHTRLKGPCTPSITRGPFSPRAQMQRHGFSKL